MKILFLTPMLPYPLDNGGSQGTLHVLNMFCNKGNFIKIISFVNSQKQIKLNKRQLSKQIIIERAILNTGLNTQNHISKITTFIMSLFSLTPFTILKYSSRDMEAAIQNTLSNNKYDLIIVNYIGMVQYVVNYRNIKKIFFSHNIDSDLYEGMAKHDFSLKWRLFGLMEWIKYILYEKRVYPKFKEIYSVGLDDIYKVKKLAPKATVKNFIPLLKYPKIKREVIPNTLLFIGSLLWYPNRDGMYWFLKEIFPLIISKSPNIKLWIVGKLPKKNIFPIYPQVTFFGYKKNLEYFLERAAIFIAPLRYGSGIHLKILQATAANIPIIATPQSLKGMPLSKSLKISQTTTVEGFIKIINKMLG